MEIEKASVVNEPSPSWRAAMLFCKEAENLEREQKGLSRIPLTPEEEVWERESDLRFLEEGLPEMRESPGWQEPGAREMLDEWEQEIREKYLEERD
jgi:hypothetical protein